MCRDAAAREGQPGVVGGSAPVAEAGIFLPVDEQTAPGEARSGGICTRISRSRQARADTAAWALRRRPPPATRTGRRSQQAVSMQDQDAEAAPPSTGVSASASNGGSLLPADMDATFQQRWKEIQTRFVDEPRGAVEDADGLVANLMQQLAEGFAKERERLEAQWGRGEDISTEDLRVALQRYRTFFQRLLST